MGKLFGGAPAPTPAPIPIPEPPKATPMPDEATLKAAARRKLARTRGSRETYVSGMSQKDNPSTAFSELSDTMGA